MEQLPKCPANYVPLTPVTFLQRAASAYADRTSIIYERVRFTWRQTYERCRRLASSLRSLHIGKNDVVSVLAPNIPAMYEMHFAVPMAGAVLNTINTRLDANSVATILRHSEAKLLFVDHQLVQLAGDAILKLREIGEAAGCPVPPVILIDDLDGPTGCAIGALEYEALVQGGDPEFVPAVLEDEWDPISLNYTSGTTSAPKGVVYTHRGAYLSTVSLLLHWELRGSPVYLWTLPMFHCNGWTFTWGVAARGGTNVCLRTTAAAGIFRSIAEHGVTHMCCAPIVFNIILNAGPEQRRRIDRPVEILTGGAPPPAALLLQIEKRGFHVTHAYGLTEATGPALVCEWLQQWDELPTAERARLKARQGVGVLSLADVDVKNLDTMLSVARDGRTVGEIVLRGSSIMKGYLKDQAATQEAFKDGWFRTGDVGVVHKDGYIEIKDRSKDVIISGGENISSVEIETVLYCHPGVAEAAVVAMPHHHWGETPCAFLALREGHSKEEVEEDKMISFCRKKLPGYMVPKKFVILRELPKTSTGKIQKFELRAMAKGLAGVGEPKRLSSFKKQASLKKIQQYDHHHQVLARSRL
ncbi:trans-cinnamate:CoA ligase, peroxisomal-like [Nymphaea colorata]|uniref:AMP-dependent synthetase/ligase domain-containing protein n=1 Tax=Nymphaea colorata TaxID=210225 RepID=A0A5K1GFF5_9MAGN|nr:trans-cinnamate:CoA ligase, peroxisomal-like [Nymphaea colorata]